LQATGPACNEPVLTGAANLTADTSCENGSSLFSFGAVSGLNTTLASNGGIGRTHAIAPTSNAVDAAFQSYCVDAVSGNLLTVDQPVTSARTNCNSSTERIERVVQNGLRFSNDAPGAYSGCSLLNFPDTKLH